NTTLVNVAFGARSTKMIGGINKENNIIRISFHFDLERESVLDVFHCEIQKSSHGLLVNIYKDITYTESICPADNKVRITNISAASNTTNAIKPPVTPADTASQNQSRKINAPIEQITLPTISNRVEEITLD
ncbi:hypothetical protein Bpfe_005401, partial [Biomphalaria pfeifferi]